MTYTVQLYCTVRDARQAFLHVRLLKFGNTSERVERAANTVSDIQLHSTPLYSQSVGEGNVGTLLRIGR